MDTKDSERMFAMLLNGSGNNGWEALSQKDNEELVGMMAKFHDLQTEAAVAQERVRCAALVRGHAIDIGHGYTVCQSDVAQFRINKKLEAIAKTVEAGEASDDTEA